MTVEPGPGAPTSAAKAPAPGLFARAPRPGVIRLRRSAAVALGGGAVALIAAALVWAFVAQPALKLQARARTAEAQAAPPRGAARPAQVITDHPASYDRLPADTLPPPRALGGAAAASPDGTPGAGSDATPKFAPRPPAPPRPAAHGPADLARGSALFFADPGPHGATLAERPAPAAPARPATPEAAPDTDPDTAKASAADLSAVYGGHGLLAPRSPYELKAGAVIPALLLTAVDTARPGPVVATVSEALYDTVTGRQLLLPQGTRLLGRHDGESRHGDRRAFLTWDRILLPNGKSLVLTGEPGVDAQGAVGIEGRADRRLGPLAVASLFAGAITTLGQAARDDDPGGGLLGDAGDAAAIEAARVGGRLIDRELEVAPSIQLRAGTRVRVLLTRDLILEPYRP